MAIDKAVDSGVLDAGLSSVAGAIRAKGGTSAQLSFPAGMVTAIGNIQTGITPSGTKSITANGTYDVTEFASAAVNVPTGALNCRIYDITIPSDITASQSTLIADLSDISAHLNSDSLVGAFFCLTQENITKARAICAAVQKNQKIMSYGTTSWYGVVAGNTGTAVAFGYRSYPLNSSSVYGGTMHIESNKLYIRTLGGTRELYAGNYRAIIAW